MCVLTSRHIWESKADGNFAVSEDTENEDLGRGTQINIYLKDDAAEYADEDKLRELVGKYSEFINFPIYMYAAKEVSEEVPVDEEDEEDVEEDEEDDEEEEDEGASTSHPPPDDFTGSVRAPSTGVSPFCTGCTVPRPRGRVQSGLAPPEWCWCVLRHHRLPMALRGRQGGGEREVGWCSPPRSSASSLRSHQPVLQFHCVQDLKPSHPPAWLSPASASTPAALVLRFLTSATRSERCAPRPLPSTAVRWSLRAPHDTPLSPGVRGVNTPATTRAERRAARMERTASKNGRTDRLLVFSSLVAVLRHRRDTALHPLGIGTV